MQFFLCVMTAEIRKIKMTIFVQVVDINSYIFIQVWKRKANCLFYNKVGNSTPTTPLENFIQHKGKERVYFPPRAQIVIYTMHH